MPTIRLPSVTRSSISLRTTNSGCCIASAASCHRMAAMLTSSSLRRKDAAQSTSSTSPKAAASCRPQNRPSCRLTYSGRWRVVMKLLKSIVRPNKVDEVKDALTRIGISGMTVTEVRGHGKQKGHTAIYRGKEYNVSLLPKMQIEVVVPDAMAEEAIKAIVTAGRTGEIGDGRVFVLPVLESYRIRTGEMEA